jgi:hypothetical protein
MWYWHHQHWLNVQLLLPGWPTEHALRIEALKRMAVPNQRVKLLAFSDIQSTNALACAAKPAGQHMYKIKVDRPFSCGRPTMNGSMSV